MAEIVGGCAVPHNPFLPAKVVEQPDGINARGFAAVKDWIESLEADVIVAFSPDHLNTMFFDLLPSLLVGIVDEFSGPNDSYPPVKDRTVRSNADLARHLHLESIRSDFDVARSESLVVDHSVLVPLQIMEIDLPVVPIVMNVLAPPILRATRARDFGAVIGSAVRGYDEDLRVLVMSDGGIIQDVGGPLIDPGGLDGAPDQRWLDRVVELLKAGELEKLVAEATPRQIAEAGNAAGELLTAVAMAAAFGGGIPEAVLPEPTIGHLFAYWNA